MTMETRILESDQWNLWFARFGRAFGSPAEPEEFRTLWRDLTEIERSLAVWDGDELVGTAGAFPFRMTVPGGAAVPTAGVTLVSVQPTHRRRGVLAGLMRRQLDDVRALGEPLAILLASEPDIYGRFGYGPAAMSMSLTVDTTRTRLTAPDAGDGVRIRLAAAKDVLAESEAVYAKAVPGRPGMLARQPGWERYAVLDDAHSRGGATELWCVLAERDGEVTGYARYATTSAWQDGVPDGTVTVRSLDALDPGTRTALWRYLFGIDLMTKVRSRSLPADDPVLHMISDMGGSRPTLSEGVFARLVEVGAALAARTYTTPVDVVLEVSDAFCPWNAGRWRLSGDASGATCAPTSDAAELALSARDLATVYLGGGSLAALAGAGRVREVRPGALAAASVAFRGVVEPWLSHGF